MRALLLVHALAAPLAGSDATPAQGDDLRAFLARIVAYEPIWFLLEPDWRDGDGRSSNAKFQISLGFQLVSTGGEGRRADGEPADGIYVSYSQTSLWDIDGSSAPFLDVSYRPEAWFHAGLGPALGAASTALEAGFGHESNGRTGGESRGYSRLFVRPIARWDLGDAWSLRLRPRAWTYVLSREDNPDIERFRGHVDLDLALRRERGVGMALQGRVGDEADRGSLQIDLTYPLDRLTGGRVSGYAQVQWFWGWSESLQDYDREVEQLRLLVGYAISR